MRRIGYGASLQLENLVAGDSRANGAGERGVQTLGEQARVVRYGLELRLGVKIKGLHALTWLVGHCADALSKYIVGVDGRPPCERWKVKPAKQATDEGEKTHYQVNLKDKARDEKLEAQRKEGVNSWTCLGNGGSSRGKAFGEWPRPEEYDRIE